MEENVFQAKVEKLYQVFTPKKRGYGGPLIFLAGANNVAFFTIVGPEGNNSFRETVYVVWSGENGNLQQEEVANFIGFFKTSLHLKKDGHYCLLNVRCEDGEIVRDFNFRIPILIIGEWCRKQPDKEIIIN